MRFFAGFKSFVEAGVRFLFLALVRAYQLLLSGQMGGSCRYEPSCSQYATQAFSQHKPGPALLLIFKRLSKCHPLGGFGFDPVPEVKK